MFRTLFFNLSIIGATIVNIAVASEPPVADFFAVPVTGWDQYYQPEFVSVSTGEIDQFFWDFGDGTTSTEAAPNHKYTTPGTYDITLIVNSESGADTLKKENYITVKDFADYPYPTYTLEEPTMAAWDSVANLIQASQLDGPNPDDPQWWGSSDLNHIKHGGGGRILFAFSNDTIFVNHERDFFGDNFIIDGEDKNIHFYYNGPNACDQTEGQDALIRFHGNDNIFRNVNYDRFPEGVHLRGGQRGLIENVVVNIICEDAMTMNGMGYKVMDATIRNCKYQQSEDKTIMINDAVGTMVVSGCYSFDGNQPIRITGGGLLVVRHCEFAGSRNNGPRFGGKNNLIIFENNYSHGTKSGIRLSDNVSAIVRNNEITECRGFAMRIYNDKNDTWARIENNNIHDNNGGIFIESSAQIDLGGGSLDIHRHGLLSGPGTAVVPSLGNNIITGNIPWDLNNNSSHVIMAKNNIWDHKTVEEVLAIDVNGSADVDPLNQVSAIDKSSSESPKNYILLENYPNPFNESTKIRYYLPQEYHIVIEIYDILGKKVCKLVDDIQNQGYGEVSWNGYDYTNTVVSSGIYQIRLVARAKDSQSVAYSISSKALYIR